MEKLSTLQRLLWPVTIIVVIFSFLFAYQQSSNEISRIRRDAENRAETEISNLQLTESIVGKQVQSSMRLLKQQGNLLGKAHLAGSSIVADQIVPKLMLGNTSVINHTELVDYVTSIQGGTATLFVKTGQDFFRVSTNIRKSPDQRAVGTKLDPNGKAIKALRVGKPFWGVVDILGTPYITGYEPMTNAEGIVVGAWYVGFEANIEGLKETVERTRFLNSGFAAILDYNKNIRFLSTSTTPQKAAQLISERPMSWEFVIADVDSWDFQVVFAYPKNEARFLGLVKGLQALFYAGVFIMIFILLFINQIKKNLIEPVGADPDKAIALVRRIAEGHLENDGLIAREHTLMADILKMRNNLRAMVYTLRSNSEDLRMAASVFEHTHDGIFITDANFIIIKVNPSFEALTGYDQAEAIGKNPRNLHFSKFTQIGLAQIIREMRKTGRWQGEVRNRRKNGQRYIAEINLYAVSNAHGQLVHYLGVFSDITLMKMQQESLQNMAYHDTLTKLPNRALFADRLDQAIAKTKRVKELFAVCYMDLDGFKPINDKMGHEAGDELLVKLAARIRDSMRSGDTVARIGGDEFGLLFCGLKSTEEAHISLQRIIDSINAPFMIKNQEVRIRASIGMVIREDDGLSQDDLLRLADNAMYQAKVSKTQGYVTNLQGSTNITNT